MKFNSKPLMKWCGLAAMLTIGNPAQASLIAYTTQTSFLAAISAPGVDTFDNMPISGVPSPIIRPAGSYSYTASATTDDFFPAGSGSDHWLSNTQATDTITFNGFSSGVVGIGGFFFGSDIAGSFLSGQSITLTATDAAGSITQTLTNTTTSTFLGFVSDGPLTSLTVVVAAQPNAPNSYTWPTVNDLILGAAAQQIPDGAIPEPGSLALLALGGLALMRRSRANA